MSAAFDPRVRRDGIGAGITLIFAFVEVDWHLWLITTDDIIRNTAGLAFPHEAKVLMQARVRADARNDGIAEWIDLVFGDIAVPFVTRRHE